MWSEVIMQGCQKVLENIMSGYGNHKRYIEFIMTGEAMSDKFNTSQVINITINDIFQYH